MVNPINTKITLSLTLVDVKLVTLPAVPQPRLAGERGDRGVRDPGPSHRGHTPHADHNLHHGDGLPPPEADRGLRGPLDNVDEGT